MKLDSSNKYDSLLSDIMKAFKGTFAYLINGSLTILQWDEKVKEAVNQGLIIHLKKPTYNELSKEIDFWILHIENLSTELKKQEKLIENEFLELQLAANNDYTAKNVGIKIENYLKGLLEKSIFFLELSNSINEMIEDKKYGKGGLFELYQLESFLLWSDRVFSSVANISSSLKSHLKNFQSSNDLKTIISPPKENKELRGVDLGLSKEQLLKLFKFLKQEKFISTSTDKDSFINAFNGTELKKGSFEKIEWIHIARNNNGITIQTVFQLLDSCNVEFTGEYNIDKDVRFKIQDIFSNDFGNIQSKYKDYKALKTPKHILINNFILNLKS